MDKTNFLIFLLIITLVSCTEPKHSIEIYLLKERAKSNDGITVEKIKNFEKLDTISIDLLSKTANYDTINKEFIYAGKFEVTSNQIDSIPFISNSEIKSLDTVHSKIQFSGTVLEKILKIKPNTKTGVQFVICLNKKPIFTGYFWSKYSSYGSTWNCFEYDQRASEKEKYFFKIYKGNGINPNKRTNVNFNDSMELIQAFKKTNRLIEK